MTCARPNCSCPLAAAIAALPTSTSAPAVRKLAAPSGVKKKPAAAARVAAIRGRFTCDARPPPSITVRICHWRRASRSVTEFACRPELDETETMSARFADKIEMQNLLFAELSKMFGQEVPLYDKSLLVNRACNQTVVL